MARARVAESHPARTNLLCGTRGRPRNLATKLGRDEQESFQLDYLKMIRDNYEVRRDIERRKDDVEADVKNHKRNDCANPATFSKSIKSRHDTSRNHASVEHTLRLCRSEAKFKTFLMANFGFRVDVEKLFDVLQTLRFFNFRRILKVTVFDANWFMKIVGCKVR